MTNHKFTDDEIIKAAECCILSNTACDCEDLKCPACYEKGCVYFNRSCADGEYEVYCEILKDALALINRQKAENERLKDKYECIYQPKAMIRAEAIKEFAERLKANMSNIARMEYGGNIYFCVGYDLIDNLVKEMTEEQK